MEFSLPFTKYVQTIFKKIPFPVLQSMRTLLPSRPELVQGAWEHGTTCCPHGAGPHGAEEGQGQPSPACCPRELCEGGHGCSSRAEPFLRSPQQQQQPRFLRIGVGQVCHSHPVVLHGLQPHASASSGSSKSWHSIETARVCVMHPVLLQPVVALLHRLEFGGFDFHPCFY